MVKIERLLAITNYLLANKRVTTQMLAISPELRLVMRSVQLLLQHNGADSMKRILY